MKELICIVCPKGCHLQVDEQNDYQVFGNSCPRGAEYGKNELLHPTRVLTSIVKVTGGNHHCCSVKTNGGIPKEDIEKAAAGGLYSAAGSSTSHWMGSMPIERMAEMTWSSYSP